jgi:hypothetical protein
MGSITCSRAPRGLTCLTPTPGTSRERSLSVPFPCPWGSIPEARGSFPGRVYVYDYRSNRVACAADFEAKNSERVTVKSVTHGIEDEPSSFGWHEEAHFPIEQIDLDDDKTHPVVVGPHFHVHKVGSECLRLPSVTLEIRSEDSGMQSHTLPCH